MSVRLFNDDQAIESLRDSDFDAHSAYGEVIDNSIQAKAHNVRIRISTTGGTGQGGAIRSVAFGDDGTGMDASTLHKCLQLGWSSRYNNRDGIGRFGVGMTMGAIHECRRVEVWSRQEGAANWMKVTMDLDELTSGTDAVIEPPVTAPVPPEFADLLANREHGTLVAWTKYDRWSGSRADLERAIDEFRVYCGRTYRDFIWSTEGVDIQVNGEPIAAIDPLFGKAQKTRFPNDPLAEVYPDIVVPWPRDDGKGTDNIIIRMSILPEEFRKRKGDGGSSEARNRYVDRNEGISILRNGREVFYGEPPYWGSGDLRWRCEEIDRWWGCEIRFPASLDRAFTVKNIKRGAQPVPQLRKVLKEKITPTRNSVLEKVRAAWAAEELRQATPDAGGQDSFNSGHTKAESVAKRARSKTPAGPLDKNVDPQKSQNDVLAALQSYDDLQKAALKAQFASQPFTIVNEQWPGKDFLETNHMGGTALLKYNMRHDFHRKTKELMDALTQSPESAPQIAEKLKTLIDLTFISYAKAETMFDREESLTAEAFIDHLRANWGRFLEVYVKTWEAENP